MKKEELLSVLDKADSNCYDFLKLCDKAKALIFDYINQVYSADDLLSVLDGYGILQYNLSPIEQIFHIAFYLYCLRFYEFNNECDYLDELGIPIHAMFMEEIIPQKKIKCCNKTYIIDFVIDFSRILSNQKHIYPKLKKLKYAIELDGFDYHSKKDQMNKDYERENNIKKDGYNVIRFTGSQVFNSPYSCVDTLISIMVNDIKFQLLEAENGK